MSKPPYVEDVGKGYGIWREPDGYRAICQACGQISRSDSRESVRRIVESHIELRHPE